MTSFIALLRGINVGGHAMIAMADLRELVESLHFTEVRTVLQSGNLVFKAKAAMSETLEKQLEKATAKRFGHAVDFLIRTADEWGKIIAASPYHLEARRDPGHLLIFCLKEKPDAQALASLRDAVAGREYFHAQGRELYLVYPDGIGRSKLTNTLIEKKLGTRSTGRNWNTVQKIAELL